MSVHAPVPMPGACARVEDVCSCKESEWEKMKVSDPLPCLHQRAGCQQQDASGNLVFSLGGSLAWRVTFVLGKPRRPWSMYHCVVDSRAKAPLVEEEFIDAVGTPWRYPSPVPKDVIW